jgi:hypothetical protein
VRCNSARKVRPSTTMRLRSRLPMSACPEVLRARPPGTPGRRGFPVALPLPPVVSVAPPGSKRRRPRQVSAWSREPAESLDVACGWLAKQPLVLTVKQSATRSLLRSASHLYRLSLQTRLFGPRVHGGLDQHVDGPSLVAERAPVKWNKDRSRQSVIANAAADARLGCETEPVRHLSRTAHRHTVVLRRRLLHRGTAIECHPRAEVARTKYR